MGGLDLVLSSFISLIGASVGGLGTRHGFVGAVPGPRTSTYPSPLVLSFLLIRSGLPEQARGHKTRGKPFYTPFR